MLIISLEVPTNVVLVPILDQSGCNIDENNLVSYLKVTDILNWKKKH